MVASPSTPDPDFRYRPPRVVAPRASVRSRRLARARAAAPVAEPRYGIAVIGGLIALTAGAWLGAWMQIV